MFSVRWVIPLTFIFCTQNALAGECRKRLELRVRAERAGLHVLPQEKRNLDIYRSKGRDGYSYRYGDGRTVTSGKVLKRIAALKIGYFLNRVQISTNPRSHIQAIGYDSKGNMQAIYHPAWEPVRDGLKFQRMIRFGQALPALRNQVESDLKTRGLNEEKIKAGMIKIMGTLSIRIGRQEYADENGTYGLTTLRKRHVTVQGSRITFDFEGKADQDHVQTMTDRTVAKIVEQLLKTPGWTLFPMVDADDLNIYIKKYAGEEFSAKDFRTWTGTLMAAWYLAQLPIPEDDEEITENIVEATEASAAQLENTPAISRDSYIDPQIFQMYETDPRAFVTIFNRFQDPDRALLHILGP